ncbi:MAG: N(4)-(beta-N-acetylglucosaminyl)-L-asparaginase [Acidobacteriota bacterium]|nr:N(4)-(beta-N-acetylglucosaminyl)-L-asparaginase [Acidobacteriota bacterium]
MSQIDRRTFLAATAAAGVGAAARPLASRGPEMLIQRSVKPIVVASSNGHEYKNGGSKTGVEVAFERITKGDDVLDALIAGVNLCELDPADTSVGYGGLPNADGVVQLDASCMHGPKKRAGGVGALEGVRTPSLVAKAVMESTDHHLLVGQDAQRFARNMGFTIEDDLNTPESRRTWLEWKRRTDPGHYLDPIKREQLHQDVMVQMVAEGLVQERHVYGTINCDGINAKGEICGVTTTSGLAWKIPGRLGDSPILGAGLYVDGEVGAAGSTGRGEANLYNLASFLIVDQMRQGKHPKDAALEALRRIKANTVEKRLLNDRGEPNFNINFYVIDKQGRHAGVSMYAPTKDVSFAVCDENGARLEPMDALLSGNTR